jgi:COP9 signalosome complex subunit 1
MQKSAMELAKNYEKQALERIRRMGIISAGLETRPVKTGMAPTQGHQNAEGWFDESASEQRVA